MTVVFAPTIRFPLSKLHKIKGLRRLTSFSATRHTEPPVLSMKETTPPHSCLCTTPTASAQKTTLHDRDPRLYTEGAKTKAARHDIEVFSMDDPATYGPEFHHLPFSRAVEQDLLSDYKVAIFTMYEPDADATLQGYVGSGGTEINITDATKFVGCWKALQEPGRKTRR